MLLLASPPSYVAAHSRDTTSTSQSLQSLEARSAPRAMLSADADAVAPAVVQVAQDALAKSGLEGIQLAKLVSPDRQPNSYFGGALASNGATLVVGSFSGYKAGVAYVFPRSQSDSNQWDTPITLTPTDGNVGDFFGATVASSGGTIVVGARKANNDSGAVYIFMQDQQVSHQWQQVAKLTASKTVEFGGDVAIDGDIVVVQGYGSFPFVKATYVFARNQGGTDQWGQVAILPTGTAVALRGDTIVIGAANENGQTGAAYVFARNQGGNDQWGQVARLIGTDTIRFDEFGNDVAIDGDTIVVGAHRVGSQTRVVGTGAAYIFQRNQGGAVPWSQVAKLTASDGVYPDGFGQSVAIDGDTVVVGAYNDDPPPVVTTSGKGAAYVFGRNQGGAEQWGEVTKLVAKDRADNDHFGGAVGLADGVMVSGASGDDQGRGAVYTYRLYPQPTVTDDTLTTDKNTPVTIDVLVNDITAPDTGGLNPASVTISRAPSHGSTSVLTTTGTITYTPRLNYSGNDSFEYRVSNHIGATASGIVNINVNLIDDPPLFTSIPITATVEDSLYSYTLTATDVDTNELLTITAPVKPNWLTLNDQGHGTALLSGTPTFADIGEHVVRLEVTDKVGLTATQSFTLTVNPHRATPPTNLIAMPASITQIDLSWHDQSADETGFVIERRTGTENWVQIATVGENVTTYSDSNLTCGTSYNYRVRATTTHWLSDPSPTTSTEPSVLITRPFAYSGNAVPITGNGIAPMPIVVDDMGTISDIDVRVDLNHIFNGDLVLTLTAPSGATVTLSDHSGGPTHDYLGTIFDDEAPTAIGAGYAPFTGHYRPDQSLSSLDRQSITGIWTLAVTNRQGRFNGSLTGFALAITVPNGCSNATPTPAQTSTPSSTSTPTNTTTPTTTPSSTPTASVTPTASNTPTPHTPMIIYVQANARGANTGTSWSNAFVNLQQALDRALPGDSIWVAAGRYTPTTGTDRSASFQMKENVAVYGGFQGNERALEQRNWTVYTTTLSGDIGTVGDASDNSYHVLSSTEVGATALLDGFTVTGGHAEGRNDLGLGGGMYNHMSQPTVRNVTFDRNTAQAGGAMFNMYSHPILTNVTFSNNVAQDNCGGGLYNDESHPSLQHVTFSDNTAGCGSGMANADHSNPTLDTVTFRNNHGGGTGMYLYDSGATLTHVVFTHNEGGGLNSQGEANHNDNLTLTDTIFDGNTAVNGAGMYAYGGNVTLNTVTFTNNIASEEGGGMYAWSNTSVDMTHVTFTANQARLGGGMANESSHPTMNDVTFSNNTASLEGGALYNTNSNAHFTHVVISDNKTQGQGGGLFSWGSSDPVLTDVTFTRNTAVDGGGFYSSAYGASTLTNVTFNGNTASGNGGGMGVYGERATTLTNVVLSGNTAASKGGGIYVEQAHLHLANVTLVGNGASIGGGLHNNADSESTIVNSIFWQNTATSSPQLYNDSPSSMPVRYTLVEGGSQNAGATTGQIDADPFFVRNPSAGSDGTWGTADDDYGDVHVRSGSPAIDAGENNSVPEDVHGDRDDHARFADDPNTKDTGVGSAPIVDLGAYEYASLLLPTATSTATATATPTASSTPTATATATPTNPDTPKLINITSDADTGDGQLAEGEVATVAVTFLRFMFSIDVTPPRGDAFVLLREGEIPGFQTTSCARIDPRDEHVKTKWFSWEFPGNIVTISQDLTTPVPLPNGHYRLLVCDTVTNAYPLLDGDNDDVAGGDFVRNFSIDRVLPTPTSTNTTVPTNTATVSATVTATSTRTPTTIATNTTVSVTPVMTPPAGTSIPTSPTPTETAGDAPVLTMDYATGRAGSVFVVTGSNYTPNTQAEVRVNGVLIGTLLVGSSSEYTVRLLTAPESLDGTYVVTVTTLALGITTSTMPQTANGMYTIQQDAPLHESNKGRVDAELSVQASILPASASRLYLPSVQR